MSKVRVLTVIEADFQWDDKELVVKASDYDQLKAENEQQAARIALYELALLVSWPEGAKGEVYDLWNEARTMGSKGDGN